MRKRLLFFLLPSLWGTLGLASLDLGVATSSATSGRMIPALSAGLLMDTWRMTFLSTGVQTPIYSHSAYRVLFLKNWQAGSFLWGTVSTGFGAGVAYSCRLMVDDLVTTTKKEDYLAGPAWNMAWHFAGPLFFNIEALFGLRQPANHLLLSFQDFVSLSFGIRL